MKKVPSEIGRGKMKKIIQLIIVAKLIKKGRKQGMQDLSNKIEKDGGHPYIEFVFPDLEKS